MPDFMTTDQFCKRHHVSHRTAERWRATGEGPAWVRVGPRKVLYRVSDCDAWAASRTFAHRADEMARATVRREP